MNLPYIQTELFHELVSMEPLLKPNFRLKIDKWANDILFTYLVDRTSGQPIPTGKHWKINPHTITKADQITAEINRIWDAIPAECKREDILK